MHFLSDNYFDQYIKILNRHTSDEADNTKVHKEKKNNVSIKKKKGTHDKP